MENPVKNTENAGFLRCFGKKSDILDKSMANEYTNKEEQMVTSTRKCAKTKEEGYSMKLVKKCLSLATAACLLMGSAVFAESAQETVTTTVDFENGELYAFKQSGSCSVAVGNGAAHGGEQSLLVSSRTTNNWDATDLDAAMAGIEAGSKVKLTAWIWVDSSEDGTMAVGKAGGDYAYYGTVQVKGREWTQITCEFEADAGVNIRFLTDSANYIGKNFRIDDVTLEVTAPEPLPESNAPKIDYTSDFSSGTDGWYARSNGSASIAVTEEGLYITGRTSTWNSPGRDFELVPGHTYNVSVQVKQDELDSCSFILSVAHTRDGEESYENIVTGSSKKGEWATLSGTYIPGRYDKFVLYVEGAGKETSFTIRNFTCAEKLDEFAIGDIPSLKELYADKFDFGTAVTAQEVVDEKRMAFYASQFGIMTPGNEMKPDALLDMAQCRIQSRKDDTAVAVKFDSCIPFLDWCRDNGVKVHGHVLVWHSQTPEAFFHEGYATHKPLCSRETMLARMENYIRQVLEWTNENYPGLIVSWDVVNEAVADGSDKLRESNWTKTVGADFVNRAFEYARKYAAEGTKLYYNDYNTPLDPKLHGICVLLDSLIADGTVDGYGFQAHYSVGSPTIDRVDWAFQQIGKRNLLLRISELDVGISDTSEENLQKQAKYYADLMKIFLKYADRIEAVQVWGSVDDLSWRADEYPLLFDSKAQPKPAFDALVEAAGK